MIFIFITSCGGGGGSSSSSNDSINSSSSSNSFSSSQSSSQTGSSSSSSSQSKEIIISKELLTLPDGSSREVCRSEERILYLPSEVMPFLKKEPYMVTTWLKENIVAQDGPTSKKIQVHKLYLKLIQGSQLLFDGDSVKINDSYITYQYTGDTSESDATGDGNNDIWFALNPDGTGTNTSGGLGNSENPTHMVTTPFVSQCTQVDKVFFCSIPENTIGEFTFCAKYCNASEFQYQLSNSTGGDWSISSSGVLTLPGQDYKNMLVKFEQVDVTKTSPDGSKNLFNKVFDS